MSVSLELLKDQVGKKKSHLITQDTVDEINKLVEDPDYGESFLEQYVSYFNVIENSKEWSTPKYINALKFFCLVEGGNRLTDAYVKVFPERLEARYARNQGKSDIGGEASRYNASQLVNEIRKVATVPIQLIHRHLLHEAIMTSAKLMHDASVSPMVRQKAAETLIKELKPTDDTNVNIKIGMSDEAKSQQAQLVDHIGRIALQQQQMLAAGLNIEDIQKLNIQVSRDTFIDVEDIDNE